MNNSKTPKIVVAVGLVAVYATGFAVFALRDEQAAVPQAAPVAVLEPAAPEPTVLEPAVVEPSPPLAESPPPAAVTPPVVAATPPRVAASPPPASPPEPVRVSPQPAQPVANPEADAAPASVGEPVGDGARLDGTADPELPQGDAPIAEDDPLLTEDTADLP